MILRKFTNIMFSKQNDTQDQIVSGRIITILLAIPSFVVWFIVFPGFLQADHQNTIAGIATGSLSEWHSLLWGFISFPFLYLSPSFGLYGIFQILVYVFAVSYSIVKISSICNLTKKSTYVLTSIFAFCPTYLLYNQLYSSDVIFSVLLVPLVVQLIEIVKTQGESLRRISFSVGFGILLYLEYELRKNALLIVVFVLLALFVKLKLQRKIIAVITISCIAAIVVTSFIFSCLLKAEPSPSQELLSVPVQQIARVYADGGEIPEEANEYLTKIHEEEYWKTQYLPYNADPVKFNFDESKNDVELTPEFVKAWFTIGLKNPVSYIKAYIDLMNPYWQMTANPATEYIDTDFMNHDIYTRSSCGDKCKPDYINQFDGNYSQARQFASNFLSLFDKMHCPIITDALYLIFFNRALPLWIYLFGLLMAIRRQMGMKYFLATLPILCILISLLFFSPVASFRYALQMYYIIPILGVWLVSKHGLNIFDRSLLKSEQNDC